VGTLSLHAYTRSLYTWPSSELPGRFAQIHVAVSNSAGWGGLTQFISAFLTSFQLRLLTQGQHFEDHLPWQCLAHMDAACAFITWMREPALKALPPSLYWHFSFNYLWCIGLSATKFLWQEGSKFCQPKWFISSFDLIAGD
jgi:hypothetical protein